MVYAYFRYSTSHQDEAQQRQTLQEWADKNSVSIDEIVKDEGVSGGVSYRDRNLNKLVKKLKAGDTLVVSELSRLGRAMGDISKLLNDELKPRKVRIVIIKAGIDINCAQMKAPDEFLFSALSFGAQLEKELIQARTQSAIEDRKERIKRDGGFFSKSGRYCTHLGNKKGTDTSAASIAAGLVSSKSAEDWRSTSPLFLLVENMARAGKSRKEILQKADELHRANPEVYCTRTGKPLSEALLSIWFSKYINYAI